jgi:putative membrane protein
MHDVLAGALAGLTATGPMTALMVAAHEGLPAGERYGLPPERVTANAAWAVGAEEVAAGREQRVWATLPVHFGYGAAMGAIYGAMADRVPGPPVMKGVGFGLLVWAGSYLGLLPAAGLHRPATRETARRNGMMIGAHVVFGAVLGVLAEKGKGKR